MNTSKKLLAVAISALIVLGCLSGCGGGSNDTIVVGYDPFSEKFSPFFATTAYDVDAVGLTQVTLLGYDRGGAMVLKGIEGETVNYNGTDYTYYGIADCTVIQNKDADGNVTSVVYDFVMREDVKFSDGEPLTSDDVIFSMYVLADPTYTGATQFASLPIVGMKEYRSGITPLGDIILGAGPVGTSELFTPEQASAYWAAFYTAGEKFAQEIVDYVYEQYGESYSQGATGHTFEEVGANEGLKTALGMYVWGFADGLGDDGLFYDAAGATYDLTSTFPTVKDYFNLIVAKYGYNIAAINAEKTVSSFGDLIDAELGDKASAYAAGVQTGDSAANIAGIEKKGDYAFSVTMTDFDATAILHFSLQVAPLHYYGSNDLYNYEQNQFGFVKGDLSGVKAKTTTPLGAGPYKFINYENGVISYEANETYWQGAPKTKYVKFQEITSNADKVAGVISGTLDITDPSLSNSIIDSIKEGNSNKELTGNKITYSAIDNNGYGYIGIDSSRVNVGGDRATPESKDLRRAFATIFAVYRDTVINSYYGERASVIQYPISNTSWAAPKPSDEGYAIAYSKDVDGNPIYTEGMTEEDKYAAALNAAVGFLKAAGYTYDEATGMFTAAPAGAKLTYTILIPADGIGDHPSYGILTAAKEALAKIGLTLEINDLSDGNELWNGLDADTVDMWAAAWGNSLDPDMYQVYHSSNQPGDGSNHYAVTDAELDKLIVEARVSDNTTYRKGVYKECLGIVLEWAVEIPTYQRQNCFIFSTERVKIDSLPKDMTPFWGWINGIESIELN